MNDIDKLIDSIKRLKKSKTKDNLNTAVVLVQIIIENIAIYEKKDLMKVLIELKKAEPNLIKENNPLNLFYAILNYKLDFDFDEEYLFIWMVTVEIQDPYLKQLIIYQSLNQYFDDKALKKFLPKFYSFDKISSKSLRFSSLGLVEDDFEKSADCFSKALFEDKGNWVANLFLATYYLETNNYENSVRQFKSVLKHRKSTDFLEYTADILFELGNIFASKLNQLKEGEKYYKECLKVNKELQGLNNNYGYCLFRLKKYKSALIYLKRALKIEEDKETPLWNILRVYKRIKDYENALTTIKRIKKISKRKKAVDKELKAISKRLVIEDSPSEITPTDSVIVNENKSIARKFKKSNAFNQENILEELLHNRILRNEEVFQRSLKIYKDEFYYGKQLVMPNVGRLDLLAIDEKVKQLIVIELKKDESYNDAISQIKKYINWVRENIDYEGYHIKGVICLHNANTELVIKAKKEKIEIQEYSFNFERIV